jgi:hypothetical protein
MPIIDDRLVIVSLIQYTRPVNSEAAVMHNAYQLINVDVGR